MNHTDVTLIDRDKSPLSAVDDEAIRLADALEAHPQVTEAWFDGSRVVLSTTAHGTWTLDLQDGADGEVFQDTDDTVIPAATADLPAADVLRDVVVPALLARPAYSAATAGTPDADSLTVYLATGRHYALALTPTDG
ncbi:hypothetical protein [Streptomyces demainii]|uniref:Uncharacterized protein n=1 Tax=Streptomyces demainii TaxID=588122 RepID=A0ABT9KK72_9ACTN|nr:hypothetical protein [Streptomyces demainii]MDP9607881.1 hypothetical protein [Streptomyces demainii]